MFSFDHDIILAALKENISAAQYVQPSNDTEILLMVLKHSADILVDASDHLKRDRDFALAAVMRNGSALAFLAEELQDDHDIVLTAVK